MCREEHCGYRFTIKVEFYFRGGKARSDFIGIVVSMEDSNEKVLWDSKENNQIESVRGFAQEGVYQKTKEDCQGWIDQQIAL